MDKKPPKNIFDAVAGEASKKQKLPKPSSPPPAPKKAEPMAESDLKQMFKRMGQLRQNLDSKIADLHDKAGVSYKDLEKYLDNPNNFSNDEWKKIQENRDKFLDKIWKEVGQDKKKKLVMKKKQTATKKRKGKMLGHRKGWMPMR